MPHTIVVKDFTESDCWPDFVMDSEAEELFLVCLHLPNEKIVLDFTGINEFDLHVPATLELLQMVNDAEFINISETLAADWRMCKDVAVWWDD